MNSQRGVGVVEKKIFTKEEKKENLQKLTARLQRDFDNGSTKFLSKILFSDVSDYFKQCVWYKIEKVAYNVGNKKYIALLNQLQEHYIDAYDVAEGKSVEVMGDSANSSPDSCLETIPE